MIELWLQLFAKRGSGSGGPGNKEPEEREVAEEESSEAAQREKEYQEKYPNYSIGEPGEFDDIDPSWRGVFHDDSVFYSGVRGKDGVVIDETVRFRTPWEIERENLMTMLNKNIMDPDSSRLFGKKVVQVPTPYANQTYEYYTPQSFKSITEYLTYRPGLFTDDDIRGYKSGLLQQKREFANFLRNSGLSSEELRRLRFGKKR